MNLTRNKKLFLFGLIIAFVIAIPLTIFILQKQQEIRSKAQASTSLTFSPSSTESNPILKNIGDEISLNIQIDPGANLVSGVRLEITYDSAIFVPSGTQPFTLNSSALPVIVQGPIFVDGKMQIVLSAGSDPTRALSSPTSLGNLKLKALANSSTPSQVRFGDTTVVTSISDTDSFSENVLSSSSPAYVQVGNIVVCAPKPTGQPGSTYFDAILTGSEEVPTVSTSATGNGQVILNSNETSANIYLCFNGLSSSQASAHIHGPANIGQEAGVIFTLPNGNFTSHTINNLTSTQVQQLKSGLWYFNVHTANNPDGEIRGQIQGLNPTPTPFITLTPTPIIFTPTPIPSILPSLTPTPSLTGAGILIYLDLHGIGRAGDNTNPANSLSSNKNPLHQTRSVSIDVYDIDETQKIKTVNTNVTYKSPEGYFFAASDLGNIPDGSYVIKVKTPGFLRKQLKGTFKALSGSYTGNSNFVLVNGDIDGNNYVDALDYNILLQCGYGDLDPLPLTDPSSTFNSNNCQSLTTPQFADLNDDGLIDRKDFNLYIREIQTQSGD